MVLKDLLQQVSYECLRGSVDAEVSDVVYDSRKAAGNTAFVCMVGAVTDGHAYIPAALKAGCRVLMIEKRLEGLSEAVQEAVNSCKDVTVIYTEDNRKTLSYMAQALFGYPGRRLTMIGITGTKGKTTTSFMLQKILDMKGHKTGVIGTTGVYIGDTHIPTKNTTPESYDIQKYLHQMTEAGCDSCIMEVSSQAMKMHRVAGMEYDYGIFTNLSPDHIGEGEHKDYEEYVACKRLLFTQCHCSVLNRDDKEWEGMAQSSKGTVLTYGFSKEADVVAEDVGYVMEGHRIGIDVSVSGKIEGQFHVNTPGRFSAYNAMAAMTTACRMGIENEYIAKGLGQTFVKGRVESVPVSDEFTVLIDYAHNAMSMESILTTMREYQPKRIVSLFGCGGNRSKLRRFEMGEISGRLADLTIVTADNSRFEDVMDIIEDIKVGLHKTEGNYIVIPDRREAIRYSIQNARPGDLILLLGKGHEDYQDIQGVRYHFDEREIVMEMKRNEP